MKYSEEIEKQLLESARVKKVLASDFLGTIQEAAEICISVLGQGKKILLCGNGGSAADCQHLAAEIVAKLTLRRKALPAIALTTDTSLLTALGNDDGFDVVFKRQVEGLGEEGDLLIGISTSGNSENIAQALMQAKAMNMKTLVLSGKGGGKLKEMADLNLIIPSDSTQRIQESHITIGHILCDLIEKNLFL